MDYEQLNTGSWTSYLPVFKYLLRPTGASEPAGGLGDFENCRAGIEQARVGNTKFADLGDQIAELVFEGYYDWYDYDDAWILQELAQVLDDQGGQEHDLLSGLDSIAGAQETAGQVSAASAFLDSTLERCVDAWHQEAVASAYAAATGTGDDQVFTGSPNTVNWQASRTPGTYYYIFHDEQYLYSDEPSGELSAWATLPERDDAADGAAQAWGEVGWYTPTYRDRLSEDHYGDDYVYRIGADGSWLARADADALLATSPPRADTVTAAEGETDPEQNASAALEREYDAIVSAAAANAINEIRELGVTEDDLSDEDIEALVEAEILAELD